MDGLIAEFSTLYNAFAFSIIVASVPCCSRVVDPSCFLFCFSSFWYCLVASSIASRSRCFKSRLLSALLPLGRPPTLLSSSLLVTPPIVVQSLVSLLPPVSSVNVESVEVDSPPLLVVAPTTSSSCGLPASFFIAFSLFSLLTWFLNIPLVNQGRVGFMLFTMSVIALYLRTPPLLAFSTSTFLATMLSAMSQV